MSAKDYLEKDYYSILGVSKDVDDATLKKKYRKLARELHPDTNKEKNAEESFAMVSCTCEIVAGVGTPLAPIGTVPARHSGNG